MEVKIKLINGGKMPAYKRIGDACLDCYSNEDVFIPLLCRKVIGLGFAMELPQGFEGVIRPRSGMSTNGIDEVIGTIDSNYRGEVKAIIINNSTENITIKKGDRICQLAIRKTEEISFIPVEELNESNRGANGFGSSGK